MGSNHQRGEQSLAQLSVVLVTQSHARPHLVVLTFSTHLFSDEAMAEFMVALKKFAHGRLTVIWDQTGTGPETSLEDQLERVRAKRPGPQRKKSETPTQALWGTDTIMTD